MHKLDALATVAVYSSFAGNKQHRLLDALNLESCTSCCKCCKIAAAAAPGPGQQQHGNMQPALQDTKDCTSTTKAVLNTAKQLV